MKRFCSVALLMIAVNIASADIVRGINIDFVTIGNPNNSADTKGTSSYGSAAYTYRIGTYEVTNKQWNDFTGAAGIPSGTDNGYSLNSAYAGAQQPANNVSWYEAAQFCNYLTSGDKSKGVYQFSGDNTHPGGFLGIDRDTALAVYGAIYCLPTEDEWYKAAYFKSNGTGYSLFANGQSTIPAADNGWNYTKGTYTTPWNVGTGIQEQNGTFDMMGNVWEWNETAIYANRGLRGGSYYSTGSNLASSYRLDDGPYHEGYDIGFRVAYIVPEPCSAALLVLGGLFLARRKQIQS